MAHFIYSSLVFIYENISITNRNLVVFSSMIYKCAYTIFSSTDFNVFFLHIKPSDLWNGSNVCSLCVCVLNTDHYGKLYTCCIAYPKRWSSCRNSPSAVELRLWNTMEYHPHPTPGNSLQHLLTLNPGTTMGQYTCVHEDAGSPIVDIRHFVE